MKRNITLLLSSFFVCFVCWGQTISPSGTATFCAGLTVTLTVNGTAAGSSFQWKKDGSNFGGNTSSLVVSLAGSYTVTISPGTGGTPDILGPVVVTQVPNPVADFTFASNNACSGTVIPFTSSVTSGTPGYTYAWDFNDGGTSSSQNPTHTFTSLGCGTGTFNVSLTVTDSKGCTNTVTKVVSVKQAPDVRLEDQNLFSPFNNCSNSPTAGNPNYTITVNNISPSAACITAYNINWGDGNTQNGVSFPLSHTYTQLGAFNLVVTAIGANCNSSKTYVIANQSNPAGSLGTLGSTTNLCASANVPFTISNWTLNSPGTSYVLQFGDGGSVTLNHPLNPGLTDDTINHLYTISSCPAGSYTATLLVTNACDQTPYTAGNIQIRIKPEANFDISPNPVCAGRQVCFNNTTTAGSYGPTCSTIATYSWNFGDGSPVSTLQTPCHTYALPGNYTVTLSSTNPCGTTIKTKQVCVTAPPAPGFILDTTSGCIPFIVRATDTTNIFGSCQNPTYQWAVTYTAAFCGTSSAFTYINSTTDTSANPVFSFTNPGTYTITQNVTNACGTFTTSKTVNVKKPPVATINLPAYSCGVVNIIPAVTVQACTNNSLTYAWTFAGGTPATATAANPGSITFTTLGNHPISVAVTNECGTTTAYDTVVVSTAPNVTPTLNQSLCGGLTAGPFNFTSTIGSPTYTWTNSNPSIGLVTGGTGDIPAFRAINTGIAPVVATIIVKPAVSNCTGVPDTFTITVNPKPTTPIVSTPVVYCKNESPVTLTATGTGANPLTWYNNPGLTGGTLVAPTPVTSATGTFNFYVTQFNSSGCRSDSAIIAVMVNPGITGNVIDSSQHICAGVAPNQLFSGPVSGGNGIPVYQWQSSVNGVTWINVGTNSPVYEPGVLNDTIQYRRIVSSLSCRDTSNIVSIFVAGALSNFNITANQVICEGFTPLLLNGGLPTGGGGGYHYVWEKSTNGITWSAIAASDVQNYQPPALSVTTIYRRKTNAAQCSVTSNEVTITVNPTPLGTITAVNNSICVYDPGSIIFNGTIGTAPFNIELVVTRPDNTTDTIRQTVTNNGPLTIPVIPAFSTAGNYTIKFTKLSDSKGCERTNITPAVTITVKPLPVLVLTNSSPICNGVSATLTAAGATTYNWSPNSNINTTTGSTVSVTPPATTTYFVRGTLNGCDTDTSTVVTVIPGAVVANAGTDQILCNATSATLAGNAASANATGAWSQLSGPAATITTLAQNNTTVTSLVAGGTYVFRWTITGQAPCPPTRDDVTIDVLSPVTNAIKNDTIICNGQSVIIRNDSLLGGGSAIISPVYSFQWESSPAGLNTWQNINGANSITYVATPTVSTCYRRKVKTNNLCETVSNSICITVNPTITNNVIQSNQQPCVNVPVNNLQGSTPTGGDNTYLYDWKTSTDSVNWISVANSISYQPPTYGAVGIHYFRRDVTSGNCTSESNVVTVTVRPDSKAIFSANRTVDCAPFDLSTAISVSPLPDSNGTYKWFADSVLFNTNTNGVFPGYTISNPGDTVDIQLVTLSQYGCKSDTMQIRFVTKRTAVASFAKDTARGCGPLNVNFTNTSNIRDSTVNFHWDFGNGDSSSQIDTSAITFVQSILFIDTTYHITLTAGNGCTTTIASDSIRIRTKPRASFFIDTTAGCSPFQVHITNNSLGAPNIYFWDYGNGHKDTTTSNGPVLPAYTYNTGNAVVTYPITLIAKNECDADTQIINVRIAPNIIRPGITIGSGDLSGCAAHTVTFNNATTGATRFTWDYGDGSAPEITNSGQVTVVHTFNNPGIFIIRIDMTNGCSDTTVFKQVTVYARPVAAFTTDKTLYCAGDTVRINNTSQNATNYRWFWGDGQTGGSSDSVHVFTAAGNYTILLRAERNNSTGVVCFDTLVKSISVLGRPDKTLQSNMSTARCTPFTLTASATGVINEAVTWTIEDTTVSPSLIIKRDSISISYTFNNPGRFSVKMVAENNAGCKDSTVSSFTLLGSPVAAFTPANLAVCSLDTTVAYLNTSTYNDNGPLRYNWWVDGVSLGLLGNFTHRYTTPANTILPRIFNTQLIATNTVGCTDTATATLQMNPKAIPQFSLSNPADCIPFIATINNTSQYTTGYRWLLNGALVDTGANPTILISQPSTPYTIRLIADNVYGCGPVTKDIVFTSRTMPDARFTLSDTLSCTGSLSTSTINTSVSATHSSWDWGDATAGSSLRNTSHLYNSIGQFQVTLIVDDGICYDTASRYVKIDNKPVADFSANTTLSCDTARVVFTNLSTGAASYLWDFGDGTTSIAQDPIKNFPPSVNPYSIKLTAIGNIGCSASIIKPNYILAQELPPGDFTILPRDRITIPDYTFTYNNLTPNSSNYTYQWDLGDLTFASTRDVTHKYLDTGYYNVKLFVLDSRTNCIDSTIKIVRIDGYPGYLYVPNAFYPNSIRSEFQTFKPIGKGLETYTLQVFDGWGKLLFQTSKLNPDGSPQEAWDGRYKGVLMQQDAYVWKISAKFRSGKLWDGMSYNGRKPETFGSLTLFY